MKKVELLDMVKKVLLSLIFLLIFVGFSLAQSSSQKLTEQEKIEQLIAAVEQLKDAEFIRGGTAYGAEKAASHLRRKLKSAGDRVKTAQDFIDGIASTSYFSGKPYYIRFKGGREITSREFFEEKLKLIENGELKIENYPRAYVCAPTLHSQFSIRFKTSLMSAAEICPGAASFPVPIEA